MTHAILGTYQHYNGKKYEVIGLAQHSETVETLVVYKALYGEAGLWVRPYNMFFENVIMDGTVRPRFRKIGSSAFVGT